MATSACTVAVTHSSLAPVLLLAWAQPWDGPGRLCSVVLFALAPYLAPLFLSPFICLWFYCLLHPCLPLGMLHCSSHFGCYC